METMCRALAQASARRFLNRSISVHAFHSSCATSYAKKSTASAKTTSVNTQSQPMAARNTSAREWPRPAAIPFQPKVVNVVQLTGYVRTPVQFQEAPDGKFWAGTFITQGEDRTPDPKCLGIPIVFEGDLAHIAACHLQLNDHVHIAGHLSADHPQQVSVDETHTSVQVLVQSINLVEGQAQKEEPLPTGKSQSIKLFEEQAQKEEPLPPASTGKDVDPASDPWGHLLDNPKQWWDYRSSKRNGLVKAKHPDFKLKTGNLVLWLNRAPPSFLSKVNEVVFDVYVREVKTLKGENGDQSWTDLVENPRNWWDNRVGKMNPKSPDFKHKQTGEALWLSSSPTWVLSKLPPPLTKKPQAATQ